MNNAKRLLARKAVKATAKHGAHGTMSKLRRDPMRTGTLLALGAAVGALAGWLAGRSSGPQAGPSAA